MKNAFRKLLCGLDDDYKIYLLKKILFGKCTVISSMMPLVMLLGQDVSLSSTYQKYFS